MQKHVVRDTAANGTEVELPACLFVQVDADGLITRIEEYVDSEWAFLRSVPDDGSAQFSVTTDPIDDDTERQFRVRPFDAGGNDGTAITVSVTLARHPDPPNVTYAFDDGTKTVTITAV